LRPSFISIFSFGFFSCLPQKLKKPVLETSRFFHSINFTTEKNPKLKIEINDGRNYLLATDDHLT